MRTFIVIFFAAGLLSTPGQARAQTDAIPEAKRASEVVDGKTLLQWQNDLKDKDPSVRETAVHMLKVYGRNARIADRDIIHLMSDRDASVRVNACITLGFVGTDPDNREAGINALIRLLRDPQAIVRYQAAMAISRLGPDAAAALPTLVNTIRDTTTWEVQQASATALGAVGRSDDRGVDTRALYALLKSAHEPCVEVRLAALQSLIQIGTPGNPPDKDAEQRAVSYLINDKQSKRVSIWARVLAMRIDKISEQHLGFIGRALRDNDLQVRLAAARALAMVGPEAKSQVPELIASVQEDKEPSVVVLSCSALGFIGRGARDAIPALKGLLNSQEANVRTAAQEALSRIDTKGEAKVGK